VWGRGPDFTSYKKCNERTNARVTFQGKGCEGEDMRLRKGKGGKRTEIPAEKQEERTYRLRKGTTIVRKERSQQGPVRRYNDNKGESNFHFPTHRRKFCCRDSERGISTITPPWKGRQDKKKGLKVKASILQGKPPNRSFLKHKKHRRGLNGE